VLGDLANLAAGAYDSYSDTFFQFEELDEEEQALLYAHELYHALQDQHFDLEQYLLDTVRQEDVNNDEVLARQAVVEGEASYVDSIYRGRMAGDSRPVQQQLADMIAAQSGWTADRLAQNARNPTLPDEMRARLLRALEARRRLPGFVFDGFVASYIEGMSFIHAVYQKGWPEVEKLYREFPPQSTEQILHPEKWAARESPIRIAWPPFDSDPIFADWQLLHQDVVGERLWRVVFSEHGVASRARRAAAGWGGDRYAVFRNRHDQDYLMLTFTVWDTEEDALEFEAAYRKVLESKAKGRQAVVFAQGREVLMVECPLDVPAGRLMRFNRRATAGR
jgi:hypothetical protein